MTELSIRDGRITFPKGTKEKDVRIKCADCHFGYSCTGPKPFGGDLVATHHERHATDETIKEKAMCLSVPGTERVS